MDPANAIRMAIDHCERLGINVREEHLGSSGGGLCSLRGIRTLFVNLDADQTTQAQACIVALASIPEADDVYLPPTLREAIERERADST